LPFIATSRLRPVACTAPGSSLVPGVDSSAYTRVLAPSPDTGTARKAVISARKPDVAALARLFASTSWRCMVALAPVIDR
jgi:hypothetical protein